MNFQIQYEKQTVQLPNCVPELTDIKKSIEQNFALKPESYTISYLDIDSDPIDIQDADDLAVCILEFTETSKIEETVTLVVNGGEKDLEFDLIDDKVSQVSEQVMSVVESKLSEMETRMSELIESKLKESSSDKKKKADAKKKEKDAEKKKQEKKKAEAKKAAEKAAEKQMMEIVKKTMDEWKANEEKEKKRQQEEAEKALIHNGYICDGCDQKIKGIRYHSLGKDDYDLCEKCEPTMHKDHLMIRIATPDLELPLAVSAFIQYQKALGEVVADWNHEGSRKGENWYQSEGKLFVNSTADKPRIEMGKVVREETKVEEIPEKSVLEEMAEKLNAAKGDKKLFRTIAKEILSTSGVDKDLVNEIIKNPGKKITEIVKNMKPKVDEKTA
jgi:hypothetical protein